MCKGVNNCELNKEYIQNMKHYFIHKCQENGLNINYLTAVTKSLIFGTFHCINETHTNKKKQYGTLLHLLTFEMPIYIS